MAKASDDAAGGERDAAFEQAVQHELEAIELHERAARRHEEIAGQHEESASDAREPRRSHLIALAAEERARAAHALARAEQGRNRLRAEGAMPGED